MTSITGLEPDLADSVSSRIDKGEKISDSDVLARASVLVARLRQERDLAHGSLEFLRVQTQITQSLADEKPEVVTSNNQEIVSQLELARNSLASVEEEADGLRAALAEMRERQSDAAKKVSETEERRLELGVALQAMEKELEETRGQLASVRNETDVLKVSVWPMGVFLQIFLLISS
jgi:chromosome segregation ATPase